MSRAIQVDIKKSTLEQMLNSFKLSRTDLSKKLGVTPSTIYNWLSKEKIPLIQLAKLESKLNLLKHQVYPDAINELTTNTSISAYRKTYEDYDGNDITNEIIDIDYGSFSISITKLPNSMKNSDRNNSIYYNGTLKVDLSQFVEPPYYFGSNVIWNSCLIDFNMRKPSIQNLIDLLNSTKIYKMSINDYIPYYIKKINDGDV